MQRRSIPPHASALGGRQERSGYARGVRPRQQPVWLELVQLVPIISLAFPFIVAGKIDLARAGSGLLVAALLTLPVSGLVLFAKGILNPILVGTGLWLWVSAVAFLLPAASLVAWLSEAQGAGLFLGVVAVGISTTFLSPQGFIGARHPDARWLRRSSWTLLALAFVALGASWFFRHDIRAGGGLPFILLNVARRALVLRAPPTPE